MDEDSALAAADLVEVLVHWPEAGHQVDDDFGLLDSGCNRNNAIVRGTQTFLNTNWTKCSLEAQLSVPYNNESK